MTFKKKTYNKLVRDHIPDIIEKKGQQCECYQLDEKTYTKGVEK
ncbi:hypothetical protein [Bacillus solimangrovi]